MKKILLISVLLALIGCSNAKTSTVNNDLKQFQNAIRKEREFIDIDPNTVKFLFKTNIGARQSKVLQKKIANTLKM